jgi:hypothetical protein
MAVCPNPNLAIPQLNQVPAVGITPPNFLGDVASYEHIDVINLIVL